LELPKPKKQKKKEYKRNEHHICPGSRIRKGDADKFEPLCCLLNSKIEIRKHAAWHKIFFNLLPEEVTSLLRNASELEINSPLEIIRFIRKSLNYNLKAVKTVDDGLDAWREIFGDCFAYDCFEKTIIKKWTYPGVKIEVSKNGEITGMTISLREIIRRESSKKIIWAMLNCHDIDIIPEVVRSPKDIIFKIT
jgi:hypothetical protein